MQSEALQGVIWLKPVFYVAIAFILFFVLFGAKLGRAITGMLDKRIALIRQQLDQAAALRAEAETMLIEAQARRAQALVDAQATIASAQEQARRLAADMQAEAEALARRRERMAMERIAAAETAVMNDLRMAAAEVSAEAARQVLAAGMTQADDAALIDRAIADLPGALRAA